MSHLPIAKIIWHKSDPSGAHNDHLHVEGIPRLIGWNTGVGEQPPAKNPGMTDSVWAIYVALSEKFGEPAYMRGGDWNHMGWYNRRTIGGSTQWSQHAWSNAIDIGPYYFDEQQKFYDFLTGKEGAMTPAADKFWQDVFDQLQQLDPKTNATFARHLVEHVRNHPSTSGVDGTARREAARANDRLDAAKRSL